MFWVRAHSAATACSKCRLYVFQLSSNDYPGATLIMMCYEQTNTKISDPSGSRGR